MIETRLRGFSVWGVIKNLALILWYNMNTMKAKNSKKTITDSIVDQDVLTYTVGEDTILDKALIKCAYRVMVAAVNYHSSGSS